ncbi:MAG: tyrosine-type recombinase/integrase [Alphaproteobacteria bacterium]|nr:tyrosine-type recombinase/integrase [Alphaproteobacteria bacterium]
MKKRIYICPSTKEEFVLPANLYPNNHKIEGKWVYKLPEGKKSLHNCVKSDVPEKIPPTMAIEIAELLNEKYYGLPASYHNEKNLTGYMVDQVEDFITWMKDNDSNHKLTLIKNGKRVDKENWKGLQSLLRRLGDAFSQYTFKDLPFEDLAKWYQDKNNFTGNTQAKARTIYLKFFTHNIHSDPRFMLLFSAGGLKIDVADKKRGRLSGSQFNQIRDLAFANNEWALVNAMDIGLLTMLRRTNICNLQFANIESDKLHVELIKKKEPVIFVFNLNDESNQALHEVIKRCRVQSHEVVKGKITTPAPNMIHKIWYRNHSFRNVVISGRQGEKNHLSSVLPRKLSNLFQEYRDMLPEIAELPVEERPTFHEIRALGCHRAIKAGMSLEDVSMLLGHKDVDTTEKFYKRGHEEEIYDVVCAVGGI